MVYKRFRVPVVSAEATWVRPVSAEVTWAQAVSAVAIWVRAGLAVAIWVRAGLEETCKCQPVAGKEISLEISKHRDARFPIMVPQTILRIMSRQLMSIRPMNHLSGEHTILPIVVQILSWYRCLVLSDKRISTTSLFTDEYGVMNKC